MYQIISSHQYRKSVKKLEYSGDYDKSSIEKALIMLSQGVELPKVYRDHQLLGDFGGCRECHIKSDLLLIYEINPTEMIVILVEIGSHSDLFG